MGNKVDVRSSSSKKDGKKKHKSPATNKKVEKEHSLHAKETHKDIDEKRHPEEQIVNPEARWTKDHKKQNDHTERI